MKKNISSRDAGRMLARVPANTSFWLCTNEYLRNLDELAKSLHEVNDEIFRYHVNRDKNDFEVWIRDVISDKELAREISRIKTRETLVRKISERVDELRKIVRAARKKAERNSRKAVRKKAKPVKHAKKRR